MSLESEQARLLTCIGEPTRLQILRLLSHGEKYVTEIVENLRVNQSLVSYHIKHLRECKIIIPRQDAQKTYYKLADVRLAELVSICEALVEDTSLCPPHAHKEQKQTATVRSG